MRAHARVALVSLAMATGGLAGCGSLDKLSDTTTGWLVSLEHPPAKIAPGEETSEPSAKEGKSGDTDGRHAVREEGQARAKAATPADGQGSQEAGGTRARLSRTQYIGILLR